MDINREDKTISKWHKIESSVHYSALKEDFSGIFVVKLIVKCEAHVAWRCSAIADDGFTASPECGVVIMIQSLFRGGRK